MQLSRRLAAFFGRGVKWLMYEISHNIIYGGQGLTMSTLPAFGVLL